MVDQWNSNGGTVWSNSGTVIVEQCCRTVTVEQCVGTIEQSWWRSVVKQWKCDGGTVLVEQGNSDSGTVWWNTRTVMVEQCGGTVEQLW